MAVTVASLMAKLGYDDKDFQSGMDGSSSKLSKFTGILSTGFMAVGTIAAGSLAAIGASVMSMQDALTPVMTLTGAGTKQFEEMSKAISDVVKTSPKSAEELGGAAYTILSAGITDTVKAQQALVDANKLSLAGLGSVPDATDLITSAMNSWKDANLSSTDAAKIFFGTVAAGKTTTAGLAQGFGGIAPLASALGVDLKSLMAATAALTATGMPASQAYSSLKAAFANILKPTKDAENAAESIGVTFDAASLKSKGLAGFLKEIGDKSGNSTQLLSDMFGSVEAGNAILALTGGQADAFANNFNVIDTAGQNLDSTAKAVSETFSNRIKIMKNNTMVHLAEIGNKGLDWLSEKWKEWGPTILPIMSNIQDGIAVLRTVIIEDMKDLADGISRALAIALPILRDFFQKAKEWVEANWPRIQEVMQTVVAWLQEQFVPIFTDIVDVVTSAFGAIVAIVQTSVDILMNIWNRLPDGFIGTIVKALEGVVQVIHGQLEILKGIFDLIKAVLTGKWGEAWDAIVQILEGVMDVLTGLFSILWNEMIAIFDIGKAALSALWFTLWHMIHTFAVDTFGATLAWIGGQLGNLVGWFASLPGRLLGALGSLGGLLYNAGVDLLNGFLRGIEAMFNWVVSFVSDIPNRMNNAVGYLGDALYNAGVNLIEGLLSGIGSMAGRAADAARNVVTGAIKSAWGALVPGSPSRVGRAMGRNFGEGIIAGMEDRMSMVADMGANIANAMVHATQYNYAIGGPGNVQVMMPQGSDGNDVVRALRDWQRVNGRIPVAVTGKQ